MILPCSTMSLTEEASARESQNRIRLSKWPLMMVVPEPSPVTRSLQLEPANLVSMPAGRAEQSHGASSKARGDEGRGSAVSHTDPL